MQYLYIHDTYLNIYIYIGMYIHDLHSLRKSPEASFVRCQVACHDMFQLMDRASLIEGLEPTGETPEASLATAMDKRWYNGGAHQGIRTVRLKGGFVTRIARGH